MIEKIKESINKDRFKDYGSYRFDRIIFQTAMFIIFGFLFFVAYSYDFDIDYYVCGDTECHNPFYEPTSWKNAEYLPKGEYGTKPGPLFNSVYYVTIGLIVLAGVTNHLIHNKGKNPFKGLSLNDQDKN